jgi:hypothetical protein
MPHQSLYDHRRNMSWRERLFVEEDATAWFDMPQCDVSGVQVVPKQNDKPATIKLLDMGPKLLLSDVSTADQPLLRWRLRVTGNTALELGVVPSCLEVSNNSLHKADSVRGSRTRRCTGFSSQITAGSHLPVKIPVVRGTVLDLIASRGLVQVILFYPQDAQEIKWNREGHPVPAPYQGPRILRFELEYSEEYDVKLACTCWAKASFEVLHSKKETDVGMNSVALDVFEHKRSLSRNVVTGEESAVTPMDIEPIERDVGGRDEKGGAGRIHTARSGEICNSLASSQSQTRSL